MSAEKEIAVEFSANDGPLLAALKRGAATVKSSTKEMGESFEGLKGTLERFQTPFIAITSLLAGGMLFKEIIADTRKWNEEAISLARTLGIDTAEASKLALALSSIYVTTETYLTAEQMLVRQLASGSDVFKRYGIETRDSNGHLRSATSIMNDVLEKLRSLEQGTNRTAAGTQFFSRSWADAQQLLRLTPEIMEEASKKAEKLNLVVGVDAVTANENYKRALSDVEDVALALKVAIGSELMPVLTVFADWLSTDGAPLVHGVTIAVKGLVTGFLVLQQTLRMTQTFAEMVFNNIVQGAIFLGANFGRVIKAMLTGNFDGVAEKFQDDWDAIKNYNKTTLEGMAGDVETTSKRIAALWKDANKTGAHPEGGGDGGANTNIDALEAERMARLRVELETERGILESFGQWSRAAEAAFWEGRLEEFKVGGKAYTALQIEIGKARADQAKEQFALDKENALALDALDRERLKGKADVAVGEIEIEQQRVAALRGLNELTIDQTLGLDRALIEKRTAIRRAALQKELQDYKLSALDRAKIQSDLDMLEVQRRKDLEALEQKARADRQQEAKDTFSPMVDAWNTALTGMEARTLTFNQGVQTLWQGLGRQIDSIITDIFNKWIAAQLREYAISAATAIKKVMSNAAVAGSAGAANEAQSGDTYGAAAVGLGLFAAVAALGANVASAAGGWDRVPHDQLAMIHRNEMVLPASIADPMRRMTQGAGPGGAAGAGGGDQYHVTIHANDAASFYGMIRRDRAGFVKIMKQLARDEG